jgi:hypothetical protein
MAAGKMERMDEEEFFEKCRSKIKEDEISDLGDVVQVSMR